MSNERPKASELPQFMQNALTDKNSLRFGPDEELLELCSHCIYNRRYCPNETNMLVPVESTALPGHYEFVDAFEAGIEPWIVRICESFTPKRQS